MSFDRARAVADAVMLEGYVLYPYRASSTKNRYRWTFGVLAPRDWSEGPAGCDPWWLSCECLVEDPAGNASVDGVLRFLQMQRRTVEAREGGAYREVESLADGDELAVPWEEGLAREIPFGPYALDDLASEREVGFELPSGIEEQAVGSEGRVVRRRWAASGRISIAAAREGALVRLRVRVENTSDAGDLGGDSRDHALRRGFLSTHLMLHVSDGAFVSLLDPPESAREAAARCRNVRVYPVLAGAEGDRDLVLAAPIILHDHPRIAPESPGDFFDATEIDELLTLRTGTLTPEEKRQARATDARAAAILDRVDHMPPEMMERLHGAVRELAPIRPAFEPGSRVRLRPGARRTDAQDILFVGRIATVERVMEDVEGRTCLAVTLDDDPAADLHRWKGRFHYYYPDEVEPVEEPG